MDCDAPIRKGARCQICELEHVHGTVSDERYQEDDE
jgi:hypothetical protein